MLRLMESGVAGSSAMVSISASNFSYKRSLTRFFPSPPTPLDSNELSHIYDFALPLRISIPTLTRHIGTYLFGTTETETMSHHAKHSCSVALLFITLLSVSKVSSADGGYSLSRYSITSDGMVGTLTAITPSTDELGSGKEFPFFY